MEEILGRPAYGRPAGPTLQPLGLSFGLEVKHTDYNCLPLTLPVLPAKKRPWSAIYRPPPLTCETHIKEFSLLSLLLLG